MVPDHNKRLYAQVGGLVDLVYNNQVQTDAFKVVLVARPFPAWGLIQGALCIGGRFIIDVDEITLPTINLEQQARPYFYELLEARDQEWPVFTITGGNFS